MNAEDPYLENTAFRWLVLRDGHVVETLVEDWFVVVDVVNGDEYSCGLEQKHF